MKHQVYCGITLTLSLGDVQGLKILFAHLKRISEKTHSNHIACKNHGNIQGSNVLNYYFLCFFQLPWNNLMILIARVMYLWVIGVVIQFPFSLSTTLTHLASIQLKCCELETLQELQLYIYIYFNCLDTMVQEYILNSVVTASLLGLFNYYSIFFQVSLYVFEILFDFNIVNWRLVRIAFLFLLLL